MVQIAILWSQKCFLCIFLQSKCLTNLKIVRPLFYRGWDSQLSLWSFFGPPQRGWELWFSLHSSVRPPVRPFVCSAEISKSVHRNFLIFGTKLGLPNAPEVTFRILPEKSRLAIFGLFSSKNGHFWLKINVLDNFSKCTHRIFLVLHI